MADWLAAAAGAPGGPGQAGSVASAAAVVSRVPASPADQKTPPKAAAPRGEIHGVAVGGSIKFRASHCSSVNGSGGRGSETLQLTLTEESIFLSLISCRYVANSQVTAHTIDTAKPVLASPS